jgi:glycosyltransferase involved in cell wall biosynthesis
MIRNKISAVIITFNEELNIARCLASVKDVADEIVVLDSFSTDQTEKICREFNVIFLQREWEGYARIKNYAIKQASNNYILQLDADEALSDELVQSIVALKDIEMLDGYYVNRRTNYCGKWIRHCGWYPDRKLRLWNRTMGNFRGNIHEQVILENGAVTTNLQGDLLHYSFNSISDHVRTADKFSEIAAREAHEQGKKINFLLDIIFNPFYTFIRKFFIQLGFLDGYYGFIICRISAFANFLKYTKIRELNKLDR